MVEVNLEACKAISLKAGLPLQFTVKEFFVFDVLAQIASLEAGNPSLAFKGGTALNKVYLGGVQRFSEDLDFDSGTESLPLTRGRAKKLAESLTGYAVSEMRRVGDACQFDCGYQSPLGGTDHVRVDLAAKKVLGSTPPSVKPASSAYAGLTVAGFLVYSIEDLAARKLHALATRAEGKDFFDASNALPLCGPMKKPIQKMLESEHLTETPSQFLDETIQAVTRADAKKLRNLTNPFIPANSRPKDWTQLKNDLRVRLERLR